MDLQALGNLGELIAAIGVVISLVYLAFQIRQNTSSVRAATYQGMLSSSRDILQDLYGGPDTLDFFIERAMSHENLEDLDEKDRLRWHAFLLVAFRHIDNGLYQRRAGTLDPKLWEGYSAAFASWLRFPGFVSWYLANRGLFSDDLSAWVTSHMEAAAAVTHQQEAS